MTLHIDAGSGTVDEFWECECVKNFVHRKGTMPKCLHEDPYAEGSGYEDSDDRLETWNVTEYCTVCDAHEQDCSDARVSVVYEFGHNLNLTTGEYRDLILSVREEYAKESS